MNGSTRIFGACAIAAALSGCGGGSSTEAPDLAMGGMPDLVPPPPTNENCTTDNAPIALAKHYGVKARLNVNVKVPADCVKGACVVDTDSVSSLLLLADLAQTGSSAMVTTRVCGIQIPKVQLSGGAPPIVLSVPDPLLSSVKAVAAAATLSGPNTCAGFASMPIAIVIGARLAKPETDPLPRFAKAQNPTVKLCGGTAGVRCDQAQDVGCVCDQDGDGKPGATVQSSGLPGFPDVDQVYLALRTVVRLDGMVFPASPGQVNPGQRIRGEVAGLALDQSPVGCRNSPFGSAPMDCDLNLADTIAKLNPLVTQSQNTASTFVAMPVPDGETCEQLALDAPTLFKGQ